MFDSHGERVETHHVVVKNVAYFFSLYDTRIIFFSRFVVVADS